MGAERGLYGAKTSGGGACDNLPAHECSHPRASIFSAADGVLDACVNASGNDARREAAKAPDVMWLAQKRQEVSRSAQGGCNLVHYPARCQSDVIFGPLAKPGQLQPVGAGAGCGDCCRSNGHFQSARGGYAGAHWHVAVNHYPHALPGRHQAPAGEGINNADWIGSPSLGGTENSRHTLRPPQALCSKPGPAYGHGRAPAFCFGLIRMHRHGLIIAKLHGRPSRPP